MNAYIFFYSISIAHYTFTIKSPHSKKVLDLNPPDFRCSGFLRQSKPHACLMNCKLLLDVNVVVYALSVC